MTYLSTWKFDEEYEVQRSSSQRLTSKQRKQHYLFAVKCILGLNATVSEEDTLEAIFCFFQDYYALLQFNSGESLLKF